MGDTLGGVERARQRDVKEQNRTRMRGMDRNYTESLRSGPATAATRGRLHGGCHRGRVGSLLTGRLKDTSHEEEEELMLRV